MTLIVSWLNKEKNGIPSIWTVGDTKISNGDSTLTLYGSKILELPLRCKDLSGYYDVYFFALVGKHRHFALVGNHSHCRGCAFSANHQMNVHVMKRTIGII